MSETETLKTLQEWAELDGIEILDPDGFDRTDTELWTRLFTHDQYREGIWRCTIMGKGALR